MDTYYHYGINREVYNDPLPMTVEDLLEADPADYSKELNLRRSILVAYYDAVQEPRKDRGDDLPGFSYDLVISAVPAWTEFLMEGWTDDYRADHPLARHLEVCSPEPWNALEAMRVEYEDGEKGVWYVRWEDRFIRLDTSWELTEQHMEFISGIVRNCAE